MSSSSFAYQTARTVYRFVRDDVLLGGLLLPYGRSRQRALRQQTARSDAHTYTCFYRSPAQLEALTGPVVDRLVRLSQRAELSILVFAASNGAEPYTLASELMYRRPGLGFRVRASDLHESMVEKARRGAYSLREITQSLTVPETFLSRTFDRDGTGEDAVYVVKPGIRERVTFEQADLLSPDLDGRFERADIVLLQNVLFHLPPQAARDAFGRVARLVKPGGALFIDGMELEMRVELTARAGFTPLDYRVKEIYQHSRLHIPMTWWRYYYGNEPYSVFAKDRLRRYATIFFAPPSSAA